MKTKLDNILFWTLGLITITYMIAGPTLMIIGIAYTTNNYWWLLASPAFEILNYYKMKTMRSRGLTPPNLYYS